MAATVEVIIEGKDSFSGVLGNFGSIMTGLKSTIDLVAGAFKGVVDFGAQFVNEATESQDAVANLEATLKSMGDVTGLTSQQLQDIAGGLQEVTRFSDETIINAEAMLLTFGNIGGEVFPRATEAMVDLAAKFGSMDQASVMLGKALNDPIAGVTALRRVGVQLSEQQEEAIKKFMEQGDIMSAQGIILAELERQVGGLAEAYGDTFAGKLEIFKNRIGEVKETIGTALLPLLTRMMDWAAQFMPAIERGGELIAAFFEAWDDAGFGSVEMLDVFSAMFGVDRIEEILPKIDTFLAELVNAIDWRAFGDAFGDLLMESLGQNVESPDSSFLAATGNALSEFFLGAMGYVNWDAVGDALADGLIQAGNSLDTTLNNFFVDLLNINEIKAGWQQIGEDLVNGISVGMSDGIDGLIANATRFWQNIINNAKAVLGIASPSTVFAQIGRDIISGLIGGFTGMAGALLAAVGNIVRDVVDAFQPVIDIITGGGTGGATGDATGIFGTGGTTGSGVPGLPAPGGTMGGTVVNQYFAGATINVGSWDQIAYDCQYPNPFVGSTSGQLGGGGGGGGMRL